MGVSMESKTVWQKIIEFKLRHSIIVTALILMCTGFFVYKIATGLKVYTDFFQLYPPKHPYIQLYKEYRHMFGTANVLTMIVEVKQGDIYNFDTITKIDRLTKALMETPGANPTQIASITHPKVKDISVGVYGIKITPLMYPSLPRSDEDLRRLKYKIYTNEGIRGIYVSPDDKATLISAGFWEEGADLKVLFDRMKMLKEKEQDANHTIWITGYPMLYSWIAYYSSILKWVFGVTALVLIVLLALYFKNITGVLIPLISGGISAIWGLGWAVVLGFSIDPLTLVVPMLLSARALSHSVQCLERYHEDYFLFNDKWKAVVTSYSYLYKPAILSIITDGLGVLTIAVCTIPLMQKLAYISSFWIISIYIGVVTLNPILLLWFPAPKDKSFAPSLQGNGKSDAPTRGRAYMVLCRSFIYLTQSWRKWVVFSGMLVIIVTGAYFSNKLKVGDTSAGKAILYNDHEYNIAADKLNEEFAGSSTMVIIAEGKKKEAMKNADSLRLLEDVKFHAATIPNVGGTLTITDIVKRLFRMYHEGEPRWSVLPEEPSHLSQTFFLLGANMAPGEMDHYISSDSKNATVTLFFRGYNNDIIRTAITSMKEYIKDNPLEVMQFRLAGGLLGILAAVNEEVEWSYWVNMALIFSLTFFLCSLTYRSLICATLLIIPLAISQMLSDTFMYLFGVDLNINSLPVAAIGVGIGVDYGIYILSRLAEEYQERGDLSDAIYAAVTTTGKAVIFTATTLVAGVIFWMFSVIKFQAEMGILLAFLMTFNMIGSILFIPVMISVIGPERTLLKYKDAIGV